LLDAENNYSSKKIDQTRAWNFQQGTMFYWNPESPESQFFFNDRDPATQEVFCVLFDISKGKQGERVREYRYKETPFGNSGVAQNGKWFLGINYGRLDRLRKVTGYPGAFDWTKPKSENPANDGIFKVNVETEEKELLVSFKQLEKILQDKYPNVVNQELFINHTLWSRDDSHILFFARADFDQSAKRINAFFTMKSDGSDLQLFKHDVGGHIEWESGDRIICAAGNDQAIVDVKSQKVVAKLGDSKIFPTPGGDVALSPDGKWFVNGASEKSKNIYTVLRLADNAWQRTPEFDRGKFIGGSLRIDPAPAWNRDGTAFIGYGLNPQDQTRQMFIISIKKTSDENIAR
jgi:hypothetical protein